MIWVCMGKPERLNKEEMEILSKASFPKIEFKYAKKVCFKYNN